MNVETFTLRKIYIITGICYTIAAVAMLTLLYILTESLAVLFCCLIFTVLIAVVFVVFTFLMRKKLVAFSIGICRSLDGMMNGDINPLKTKEEETLFAKINYRLTRLYETMQENNRRVAEEKASLQALISDISHQVKMPISNLKIINSTLLDQNVPYDKQREFLHATRGQLDKLDFLIKSLVKMSRLETGVFTLSQRNCSLYETLAAALGGILLAAESKNIHVSVDCPKDLMAFHDSKWTEEALFNILDNAVKYTENGGAIKVTAANWEMYTKVDISDTGKGIPENRQAEIFKRFYREEEVHNIEGIGLGLYLAREIITMQGGYIRLTSEVGKGSVFSIFLPNR